MGWKQQRVLVTGGSGFLGSSVVRHVPISGSCSNHLGSYCCFSRTDITFSALRYHKDELLVCHKLQRRVERHSYLKTP
jgi:UDP-glucose 4-epimerase